jgi:hypothetical protein
LTADSTRLAWRRVAAKPRSRPATCASSRVLSYGTASSPLTPADIDVSAAVSEISARPRR